MKSNNRSPFQARSPGYRIENKVNETDFYIYDEIGWFGVSAETMVKDINAIKSGTINFRINSPGGSVFDGLSIFNAIKQHASKTVAYIDGLAASISSVIALAADEVVMAKNAFFMIHDPWSIVMGSAADLRIEADLLDKISGSIVDTYVDNSNKSEEEIRNLMSKETWMTANEALEAGFIDTIYESEENKVKSGLFDLSIFANVPDKLKKKELTARELERTLRDAGCSAKQAKAILAQGFYGAEQRDVVETTGKPNVETKKQRDVVKKVETPKNFVSDLLIRAEMIAPSPQH